MTERKWTPGPWFVRYHRGETQLVMGDGDVQMCDATYYPWVPENHADWHLIAAAPDLYEALQAMIDLQENATPFGGEIYRDRVDRVFDQCRAALAKARGET